MKIKHRYYSAEQIEVMSKLDLLAEVRNETDMNDSNAGFICMECGSVDIFNFRSITSHNVTVNGNGELDFKPLDLDKIPVKKWFDIERNKGNILMPTCARCGGPTVERGVIIKWCEENHCLGCMYCGKVSPRWKVELTIENCATCMGGEMPCSGNCMNKYMRNYYGIENTVYLLKAPEDHER